MKYLSLLVVLILAGCTADRPADFFAVGTYTDTIHICKLDPQSGAMTVVSTMSGVERPSFLARATQLNVIYAVSETADGKVIAFGVSKGSLTPLGETSSRGSDPCALAVSSDGRWIAAGNYSSTNWSVIPLNTAGVLDSTQYVFDHGMGSNVHDLHFAPDNSSLYIVDLGRDRIYAYNFNSQATSMPIDQTKTRSMALPSGGVRHMAYNPSAECFYTLSERSGQVVVGSTRWGELKIAASADTVALAADSTGTVASAEIVLSSDGKYLYTSHRGVENSIVQYRIDMDGVPRFVEKFNCGGLTPRSFAIDPTGGWMIIALQGSDRVVVMSIDKQTGSLSPTTNSLPIAKPTYILPFSELQTKN